MFSFKKALQLAFMVSLLLFPVAKDAIADIRVEHDDFLETTMQESFILDVFVDIRPWHAVYLRILKEKDKTIRSGIILQKVKREWHFFTENDLLMKIDGGDIIRIPCNVADSRREGRNRLATRGVYVLNKHILNQIKNVNQVEIRVTMRKAPAIIWEVLISYWMNGKS